MTKKSKEDRSWNKYQTRPKYINCEPRSHFLAKKRIASILEYHFFIVWLEANIAKHTPILHKGKWVYEWPVDILATHMITDEQIIVQIDGGYHQASKIQKGRTKNRDDTLKLLCELRGIRYIVFDSVEDVLHEYTDEQLIEMLGLKH